MVISGFVAKEETGYRSAIGRYAVGYRYTRIAREIAQRLKNRWTDHIASASGDRAHPSPRPVGERCAHRLCLVRHLPDQQPDQGAQPDVNVGYLARGSSDWKAVTAPVAGLQAAGAGARRLSKWKEYRQRAAVAASGVPEAGVSLVLLRLFSRKKLVHEASKSTLS